MEELALMAPFFCPRFFCPFKSPAIISIDVNMPFNVHALQHDQNVVKHWIPDARTYNDCGLGSDNYPLLSERSSKMRAVFQKQRFAQIEAKFP